MTDRRAYGKTTLKVCVVFAIVLVVVQAGGRARDPQAGSAPYNREGLGDLPDGLQRQLEGLQRPDHLGALECVFTVVAVAGLFVDVLRH